MRAFLLCLLTAGWLIADGPSAAKLFSAARKAEKAGHMAEAYLLYSRAAALNPQNIAYWQRSQEVHARAVLETKPAPVEAPQDGEAAAEPQEPHFDPPSPRDLADAQKPLPPTGLAAQPVHKDFDLRADPRKLFEDVAHAFGLECEFDADYAAANTIHFRLMDVDYREALHGLELATGSFIVPLSSKRFLVAKDTAPKRAELEPVVAVEIHLPEATNPQDASAIVLAVQQSMALQKVLLNTATNTVVIRDAISKVLPARALFENLMFARAQVAFELRFMEVSRNDALTYGIDLQTQFPLVPLTQWLNNSPSLPSAISGLLTFGGGKTLLGLGVMNASMVAKMSQDSGNVLLESMMESVDGQPATLIVGEKYPIQTSGYYGPASFESGPGTLYTPPPSFNYEDLGLTLKVTPSVHDAQQVTLDLDAEFKLLTGAAIDGIPILSNRVLKSRVRLDFGEWAVVAGLMNSQETRSIAGLAGLSRIPYLGPLLSVHNKNDSGNQVLILVRPHLLSLPPSEMRTTAVPVGSDTKPITPL